MAEKKDEKTKAMKPDKPEEAIKDTELSDEALMDVTGGSVWDSAIRRAKEDRWFPTF